MVFQIIGRNNKKEQDYLGKAVSAWDQAWDILQQTEGWHKETAESDVSKGCVMSRKFDHLGKVFKLEGIINAPVDQVFEVLVPGVLDWPKWNPTILECKPIQTLNENTDISYSVGAAQVGGLVSSRDFVNLRHWKSKDGVLMSSACGVVHPDAPTVKQHVRAENKPASYVFKTVPGEPKKCHFMCFLNTDLKGWLPQFLIDQAMSGVLMQYLEHLKVYLIELHKPQESQRSRDSIRSQEIDTIRT
jgi:hypothetical protein